MMLGNAVMLGNVMVLRDVVMCSNGFIVSGDSNIILHFKLISFL